MLLRSHRFLSALAVLVLAVGLCPARADGVAAMKEKLYQAKKEYDGEARKFRKAVTDWFDKRETDARKTGNKKLLDQVKVEREGFEQGEAPANIPSAIQGPIKNARAKLDKAYTMAIKANVQAKEDKLAEATEQEQKFAVDSALLFGKRVYLTQLKPFDLQVFPGWYELDSKKAKMDGEVVPHSILLHPQNNSFSNASFNLGGKAAVFRATVGIPKHEFSGPESDTALTFEVLGDGKSLWKSEPVQKLESFQTCTVRVEKVKTLSIRVHCPGSSRYAHGTWFTPFIVE